MSFASTPPTMLSVERTNNAVATTYVPTPFPSFRRRWGLPHALIHVLTIAPPCHHSTNNGDESSLIRQNKSSINEEYSPIFSSTLPFRCRRHRSEYGRTHSPHNTFGSSNEFTTTCVINRWLTHPWLLSTSMMYDLIVQLMQQSIFGKEDWGNTTIRNTLRNIRWHRGGIFLLFTSNTPLKYWWIVVLIDTTTNVGEKVEIVVIVIISIKPFAEQLSIELHSGRWHSKNKTAALSPLWLLNALNKTELLHWINNN